MFWNRLVSHVLVAGSLASAARTRSQTAADGGNDRVRLEDVKVRGLLIC